MFHMRMIFYNFDQPYFFHEVLWMDRISGFGSNIEISVTEHRSLMSSFSLFFDPVSQISPYIGQCTPLFVLLIMVTFIEQCQNVARVTNIVAT